MYGKVRYNIIIFIMFWHFQEGLQLKTSNGVTKLVGLVELEELHDTMAALNEGDSTVHIKY